MTKKTIFYSFTLFTLFLIILTPAQVALKLLPSNQPINFVAVSDSVWKGNAAQVSINQHAFNNVSWTINPLHLFMGKIGGGILVDDTQINITGTWRMGFDKTIYLSDMDIKLPANSVAQYLPYKGVELGGDIRFAIDSFSFNQESGPQDIEATVFWLKGKVGMNGNEVKLGNFTLEALSQENGSIVMGLKPSKNTIDAKGQLTLTWPRTLDVDLNISEQVPENLQGALAFMKPSEPGRRQLKMTVPINQ